jgi:hypothetical protein
LIDRHRKYNGDSIEVFDISLGIRTSTIDGKGIYYGTDYKNGREQTESVADQSRKNEKVDGSDTQRKYELKGDSIRDRTRVYWRLHCHSVADDL